MIPKNSFYRSIALCALLVACEKPPIDRVPLTVNGDSSEVLATVDGTAVTRSQLHSAARRLLGERASSFEDTSIEKQLLESLIDSRAIAITAKKSLTNDEIGEIEQKVRQYREELLAKLYLSRQVTPTPVSESMVEEYYRLHEDQFGGATIRRFDYWQLAPGALDAPKRKEVMEWIAQQQKESDWSALAQRAKAQKLPLELKHGESAQHLLNEPLKTLVTNTDVGKQSALQQKGDILLVRVTDERKQPGKALALVKDDIRRRLAPVQLKAAIKTVAVQARQAATIKYSTSTQ